MTRARNGAILLAALLALGGGTRLGAGTLAYDVRSSVIVLDAEKASRALTDWAEGLGGYFVLRSLESVVVRIPADRVGELRAALQGIAELVVTYEPSTTDVREELGAVQAAIKSREEALTLILGYVDKADVAGTLALEQEIAGLVSSVETLQGRKQRLENDAAYARVEVSLSSRRQTVPTQRLSSFAWVNTVDLYRFLREVLPYGR
jgi:hypothetical protein